MIDSSDKKIEYVDGTQVNMNVDEWYPVYDMTKSFNYEDHEYFISNTPEMDNIIRIWTNSYPSGSNPQNNTLRYCNIDKDDDTRIKLIPYPVMLILAEFDVSTYTKKKVLNLDDTDSSLYKQLSKSSPATLTYKNNELALETKYLHAIIDSIYTFDVSFEHHLEFIRYMRENGLLNIIRED